MVKNLLFAFILLFTTSLGANQKPNIAKTTKQHEPTRLESWAKLQKVLAAVEILYVDDLKLQEIVDKTITGLLHELDAHSSMLNKEVYKEMKEETKGKFGGLGIVVGMRDGALTVISPIDGTPAFKAGVKAGDIILKINDQATIDMSLAEAVKIMRGKVNTPIDITVVRKGESEPIKIHIVRGMIDIQSVFIKTIGDDILYIRISSFMDMTIAKQLKQAILKHKKTTKAIVLDLRNNPGGQLSQAIDVVDLFVDNGVIVSQKGRDKRENLAYEATSSSTVTDVPMVVLVNGGSASASEIVSGALQDFKRAILIGQKTFGKGSVQRIIPITDDDSEAIKITIAKYYLPSGRTIQAKGITPDIEVYPGKVLTQKESEFALKEANMRKHLKGELEKIEPKTKKETKKEDKTIITQKQLMEDNQLKAGVDILKSLIIMKQ